MSKNDNHFLSALAQYKTVVDDYVHELISEASTAYEQHPWSASAFSHLEAFLKRGKGVRGSLILALTKLEKNEYSQDAVRLAALVELVHAGLLIQDDFMDGDRLRRGQPTLYSQYEDEARSEKLREPELYGISLATCVSDICFFAAFGELSKLDLPKETLSALSQFISKEYMHVGFAQMSDTAAGYSESELSEEQIAQIYLYKTARYTFSLPFGIAALSLGFAAPPFDQLIAIGEEIGIIFQIRDDYLNLFGDPTKTGKPIGSDVVENKQTLYRLQFLKANEDSELASYFGKKDLSPNELSKLQAALETSGTLSAIEGLTEKHHARALELIDAATLSQTLKTFLIGLLDFVKNRER